MQAQPRGTFGGAQSLIAFSQPNDTDHRARFFILMGGQGHG